jgi:hypothetical protein
VIALLTAPNLLLDRIQAKAPGHIGRLVTPRQYTSVSGTIERGMSWAADCDGYSGLDTAAYIKMLASVSRNLEGLVFVVLPDKVADPKATLRLYGKWQEIIREDLQMPAAFVLQDGVEQDEVPWDQTEAVFIGGTTPFKFSGIVRRIVDEAKERGKWVHMGRVSTPERAYYARSIGCDSFDGSRFARWPNVYMDSLISILTDPKLADGGLLEGLKHDAPA